ncbi:NUDIX domain-containing protein [Curtobacterium flaccumfaciens]|uniref:NUDIX domain-containing protein n=1 Tax=Curtobacterium flaccumfaciens TaxID=2035 RepID=UPI0035589158
MSDGEPDQRVVPAAGSDPLPDTASRGSACRLLRWRCGRVVGPSCSRSGLRRRSSPSGGSSPGGSAFAGETGPAAACRELLEETNVTVEPEALRRVGRFTEDTALVDLFVVQEPSGSAVRADPTEVMDWRWVSLSEVAALRQSGVMAEPWGPRLDALWPAATASILAADDSRERTSPPHESR